MNNGVKKNILDLVLQAENEYHDTMKNGVKEAEAYTAQCKERQSDYIEELKNEWHLFEKSESEKFEAALLKDRHEMEARMAKMKEQLKILQSGKIDLISERLKKEVLSLYGGG